MKIVVAIIAFFVVFMFVTPMLGGGIFGMIVSLFAAFIAYLLTPGGAGASSRIPAGFTATFKHDHIAIDQEAGKLWVSDGRSSTILDKNDVLRWNIAYVSQGAMHFNNKLEIHTRDLGKPMWKVPFSRHSDRWKANANYDESEEWASRLTTWVKNT